MTQPNKGGDKDQPLSSETDNFSGDNIVVTDRITRMFAPYQDDAIMSDVKATLLRLASEGILNE